MHADDRIDEDDELAPARDDAEDAPPAKLWRLPDEAKWPAQAEMFANRLRKNDRHLRKWARREPTEAWRVYDRDIPELPFVVDWYGDQLHIAELVRAGREQPEARQAWIRMQTAAAATALGVPAARVHLKQRVRRADRAQYERLGQTGYVGLVSEHGLRFEVNLDDYLDTGLFLDHRPLRGRVRRTAERKTVLNLFAYTGAFTVHAVAGGASRVTSVDLSRTYTAWGERNLKHNGLDPRQVEWVTEDACRFVFDAVQAGRRWNIIVLDPPTFSNSARSEHDFDVMRDHGDLVAAASLLLLPGGTLYFSTNARRFRFDVDAVPEGYTLEDITAWSLPDDFRTRIHRCWQITAPAAVAPSAR